jgi:hypothetical protein
VGVASIPTAGAAGLAIKVFLRHHQEHAGERTDDPCSLSAPWDEEDAVLEKAIIRDVVRFVPELTPLAASFINGTPIITRPHVSAHAQASRIDLDQPLSRR